MNTPQMNYCMHCGCKLESKYLPSEAREIPFCPSCNAFRFPMFNTAVSMIITNPARDQLLLIQQYGKKRNILVAGYVNQGEDAEDAVRREISEEMGLQAEAISFNRSHYFAPSNTLMLNFTAVVSSMAAHPNGEIDAWQWFTPAEARASIAPGSLAEAFLLGYLDKSYHFPAL